MRSALLSVGLVAAVFLAYAPALDGGYILDDDVHITGCDNLPTVQGLINTWTKPRSLVQYYPLVHTLFWVEHKIWGYDQRGYHVVNVLIHGLAAVVLWRVLRRLKVPGGDFAALLAAVAFALHPVQAESVAWISERKNTLSMLLYLLTFAAYLRFDPTDESTDRRGGRGWWWLALLLFVAAMLSKSVVATMPAAWLVLVWWKRGRITWRDVKPTLAFFAVGIALGLHTAYLEFDHVRARGPDFDLSPLQRLLIAGRAVLFYLGKLLWPADLIFIYPRWTVDASEARQYLYPIAALALTVALWLLRRRIGRGPLAAWLCFIGTLFPVLGFLNIYFFIFSFVADHFQYHATPGIIVLVSCCAAILLRSGGPRVQAAGLGAAALLLGTLTFVQCHLYYRDAVTLWSRVIERNPRAFLAHTNLGTELSRRSDFDQALAHLRKAIEIRPTSVIALNNLGTALLRVGQFEQAVNYLQEAARLREDFTGLFNNLGIALEKLGRTDEAEKSYERAIQLHPDDLKSRNNLADLLRKQGRHAQARQQYEFILRSDPRSSRVLINLAGVLMAMGEPSLAAGHYQTLLTLDPQSFQVHHNLAMALTQMGKTQQALSHLQRAVQLKPDSADTRFNLASMLQNQGQHALAAEHFAALLTLTPDDMGVRLALALNLSRARRFTQARSVYDDALRLAPTDPRVALDAAWFLATCPDPTQRDDQRMLALAQRLAASAAQPQAIVCDTLAACFARAGDFPQAVRWQKKALEQVPAAQASALRRRLELYQARQPFQEQP